MRKIVGSMVGAAVVELGLGPVSPTNADSRQPGAATGVDVVVAISDHDSLIGIRPAESLERLGDHAGLSAWCSVGAAAVHGLGRDDLEVSRHTEVVEHPASRIDSLRCRGCQSEAGRAELVEEFGDAVVDRALELTPLRVLGPVDASTLVEALVGDAVVAQHVEQRWAHVGGQHVVTRYREVERGQRVGQRSNNAGNRVPDRSVEVEQDKRRTTREHWVSVGLSPRGQAVVRLLAVRSRRRLVSLSSLAVFALLVLASCGDGAENSGDEQNGGDVDELSAVESRLLAADLSTVVPGPPLASEFYLVQFTTIGLSPEEAACARDQIIAQLGTVVDTMTLADFTTSEISFDPAAISVCVSAERLQDVVESAPGEEDLDAEGLRGIASSLGSLGFQSAGLTSDEADCVSTALIESVPTEDLVAAFGGFDVAPEGMQDAIADCLTQERISEFAA
jgi:hypothetical protein